MTPFCSLTTMCPSGLWRLTKKFTRPSKSTNTFSGLNSNRWLKSFYTIFNIFFILDWKRKGSLHYPSFSCLWHYPTKSFHKTFHDKRVCDKHYFHFVLPVLLIESCLQVLSRRRRQLWQLPPLRRPSQLRQNPVPDHYVDLMHLNDKRWSAVVFNVRIYNTNILKMVLYFLRWPQQWYLNRGNRLDMNVQGAWAEGATGKVSLATLAISTLFTLKYRVYCKFSIVFVRDILLLRW